MKILIIGGNRFVGYLLVWRLIAAGARVTTFNRGTIPDPFGERIERLHGDRTASDFERLLGGRSFDAVVDFAAYRPDDVRRAIAVFEGGRAGHYVFVSTGQVYLVRDGCPRPARESDYDGPLVPDPGLDSSERPSWVYGIEKRGCEDVLAASRFPSTRIRIPMVNGERDHHRRIESYLRRILDGGPVIVPDGGTRLCRHVYGADVAKAIAALLGRPETFGRAYNLSQREQPSLRRLLEMLAELTGAPDRLVAVPAARLRAAGLDLRAVSPFSGPWMSNLDPALAEAELGFRHEPLDAYLGKIVASFLAHPLDAPPEGYERRGDEIALAAATTMLVVSGSGVVAADPLTPGVSTGRATPE